MAWHVPVGATAAAVCVLICVAFVRRHTMHMINPLAQTISMRCAVALGLGSILYFVQLTLDLSSWYFPAFQVLVDATAASLDSIVLVSAYFLVVVQVGGTERAIDVLAKHRAHAIPPSPAFDSPCGDDASTQDYDQVRHARAAYMSVRRAILWFAFAHPVLVAAAAILDVAADPRVDSGGAATAARVVLALCNLAVTGVAIVTWVNLVKRFDAAIAAKFKLKGKAVIVVGFLLLRCGQWSLYKACVPPRYRGQFGWFWALCLTQLAVLTAGFARTFAPSTFHAMSHGRPALARVWEVLQHPVPECRTLHDTLATEFAGGASTKQLHHHSVEY